MTLEVFRAARSRRGDKGRSARRFLEALHFFTVQTSLGVRCPRRSGTRTAFGSLNLGGHVRDYLRDARRHQPHSASGSDVDSKVMRAHVSAADTKEGRKAGRSAVRPAASPPRSTSRRLPGPTARLRADRRPSRDSHQFTTLLDIGPDVRPRAVVADKGYDAEASQTAALACGICAVTLIAPILYSGRRSSQRPPTRAARASNRRWASLRASSASPYIARRPPKTTALS